MDRQWWGKQARVGGRRRVLRVSGGSRGQRVWEGVDTDGEGQACVVCARRQMRLIRSSVLSLTKGRPEAVPKDEPGGAFPIPFSRLSVSASCGDRGSRGTMSVSSATCGGNRSTESEGVCTW